MANNPTALQTEMLALLTSTTNLDPATKTLLRNSFVTEYAPAWQAYLTGGGTDTAANRGAFAIERTFDFWRRTVESASHKANVEALPPPATIE